MAAYKDKCRQCGREFTNYDECSLRFCCVGCHVDWCREGTEEEKANFKAMDRFFCGGIDGQD